MAYHAKGPYLRPAHAALCPCPRVTAHRRLQHAHRQRAGVAQWSQRIYFGRASMAVMSRRNQAQQVVLVVLGLGSIVTNVYALVTFFLAGLLPNEGPAAPMY